MRLNWCFTEYYAAGTGKTLPEALERGLGIKIVSTKTVNGDDEGLLV